MKILTVFQVSVCFKTLAGIQISDWLVSSEDSLSVLGVIAIVSSESPIACTNTYSGNYNTTVSTTQEF